MYSAAPPTLTLYYMYFRAKKIFHSSILGKNAILPSLVVPVELYFSHCDEMSFSLFSLYHVDWHLKSGSDIFPLPFPLKTEVTRFHSQLCPYSGTPVGFLSTRLVALCLPPKGNIYRSAQWEQEGCLFSFILGTPSPCTVLEGLESTTTKLFTSVQVCRGACFFVSEMATKIQKQSKEWKTMPFVLFKVLSALCWNRTMKYSFLHV